MSKNENLGEDSDNADLADNHKWADRLAADRQRGLEKMGLIAVAIVIVAAIFLSLW